jgi:hypothetical protein
MLVTPDGVDGAVVDAVGPELAEAMAISVKQVRGAAVEGIRNKAIGLLTGGDDAKFTVRTRLLVIFGFILVFDPPFDPVPHSPIALNDRPSPFHVWISSSADGPTASA